MLLEIPIGPNDAGQRAERFLRRYLPALSAGRLQSLFRRDEIKIARRPISQGQMLKAGEVLQVFGVKPEETSRPTVPPQMHFGGAPPPLVYEDEELLVVDKPAGMAAHPGTGVPPGASLIEIAQAYLGTDSRDAWSGELFAPSLVHRLDKETSGVLLIAKTGARLRALTAALRAGEIRKRYVALVAGHPHPGAGEIDAPLRREDNASGAKSLVDTEAGRHARTRYRTLKTPGSYALLQVIIETGRMHQIRAHLSHIGHPVAGDTRYGRPSEVRDEMRALGLRRLFLHAEELSWVEAGKTRSFRAPLPPELLDVVTRLENAAPIGSA